MFTIVLPVRNGWPYVETCVASVLAQSDADFELLILDNASTDGTQEWLATLDDPRIRIVTSDRPLNIAESWGRILAQPRRRYMTMVGHDDLFDPGYLRTMRALIAAHPDAGLYQCRGRMINAKSERIRACRPEAPIEYASDYLTARYRFDRDVFGSGYMMASRDYDRVGGIPPFEKLLFADDALWLELMAGSYKAYVDKELFSVRLHTDSESASLPSVWRPILTGLGQFYEFLTNYVQRDPTAAAATVADGADFFLTYHRYVLIYALVEASTEGRKIAPDVFDAIVKSLTLTSGFGKGELVRAPVVRALLGLNASPLRRVMEPLWRLYYVAKHLARKT